MNARMQDLRVDHVGSLLRPRSLIDAFLARGRGEIDEDAYSPLSRTTQSAMSSRSRKPWGCRSSATASIAG